MAAFEQIGKYPRSARVHFIGLTTRFAGPTCDRLHVPQFVAEIESELTPLLLKTAEKLNRVAIFENRISLSENL